MEKDKFEKKLLKKNIDKDNLTEENLQEIIKMKTHGDIDTEVFSTFLKEANITYTTFINSLKEYSNSHMDSSNNYTSALRSRLDDLTEQAKNIKTPEDEEKLDAKIEDILNRLKQESSDNRQHSWRITTFIGGIGVVVIGGAVLMATKNPDVFKKGMEMIAKETVKQIV